VPKATRATAKSTHRNGSLSVSGHELIKPGKKQCGRAETGASLGRRQAEPGRRGEEAAVAVGAAALPGCATPKAAAPLRPLR